MTEHNDKQEQDELFLGQLKDQFVFFYAATITAIDAYKQAREQYQNRSHVKISRSKKDPTETQNLNKTKTLTSN